MVYYSGNNPNDKLAYICKLQEIGAPRRTTFRDVVRLFVHEQTTTKNV